MARGLDNTDYASWSIVKHFVASSIQRNAGPGKGHKKLGAENCYAPWYYPHHFLILHDSTMRECPCKRFSRPAHGKYINTTSTREYPMNATNAWPKFNNDTALVCTRNRKDHTTARRRQMKLSARHREHTTPETHLLLHAHMHAPLHPPKLWGHNNSRILCP